MGGMLRWQSCSTSDFPLKRTKVVAACQPCRTKKMRCDGRQPCSRCIKNQKKCEYRPSTSISHHNTNSNDSNKKSKSKSSRPHTPPPSSNFQWARFKKLSFHQDLYAALNLSTPPLTSKSGKLPPLLLEFYHLTAQPITIWTRLHLLFLKWFRHQKSPSLYSIRIPADVAKEAIHLFFKYNSLYTMFMDASDITSVLDMDPFFPSSIITTTATTTSNATSNNSNSNNKPNHPAGSLLLDTILALTFLAAGQTIGSEILLDVARFFYDTVHQRWLTMTFPSTDTASFTSSATTTTITLKSSLKNNNHSNSSSNGSSSNSSSLKLLTQTAILLIHFQCTAICEEQAYMTSRIAQGCLERLLSMDQVTKTETLQQHSIHDHAALRYTLYAWQVWFALYLYDGQFLVSPITQTISASLSPPLSSSSLVPRHQQLWTWTVLTRYTMFMESLLRSNQTPGVTIQEMMDKGQALESLSTMNKGPTESTTPSASVSCSEQLVGLYHTMLTIQLFSSQWLPHLDFFTTTTSVKLEQQSKYTDDDDNNNNSSNHSGDGCDMSPSKKICIEASQRIIQMVSAMIMSGQYITAHRSSSPLLLFIRYRALCFAAVILVPIRQQQLLDGEVLSTYLDDSLHQLKQIMEKDLQIWPMARQCLYYLHQRLPSYFDIQDTSPTDEGFLSHYDGVDDNSGSGTSNGNNSNNNWVLDDQHGRLLQTSTAMTMTYSSRYQQQLQQRHWHGMKKRDHIDQEQLNKLSLQHDQLSNYATTATTIGKRPNGDQQRNENIFYSQPSLLHDANYSRKRHRTYPATTMPAPTTLTTDYWLSPYSLNGNNMGGPGSYLVFGNDDQSSMLLSTSSSTGSSVSTSTALSVLSAPAPTPTSSAVVTTSMKASSPIPTVSSARALSETPAAAACLSMAPMLSTAYPAPLQQQVICVSQSMMAPIGASNNGENSDSASFDLMQQAEPSTPSSSLTTYHPNQIMVPQQQQQQQEQTMTAIAMTPTASSTSMTDNSNLLPSYQSSFNNNNNNNKRLSATWQYQPSSNRQLLHDTFTASIMETLHATTHDQSMLIHGATGETQSLPPAPTSSPVNTPTPSFLDDVHLQAVSRGLSHHVLSMTTLTRTASVESTTTTHPNTNRDLISNDRHTEEWLYFLYEQQQQQQQRQQQQQQQQQRHHQQIQTYQQHQLRPPSPSQTESAEDPFILFSSPMSSIPRK